MYRKILFLLLVSFFSLSFNNYTSVNRNGEIRELEKAIREGDAKTISKYFYSNIQMNINRRSNIYSKKQAEKILTDFFLNNKPVKYVVKSERKTGNFIKVLGSMDTDTYSFRVYYRILEEDGKYSITSFEIIPI